MNTHLPEEGQWYALCTRPKCEKKVAATLNKKKFETYLPLRMTHTSWGFLRRNESEPLFPGLVFVRLSGSQAAEVRCISGVTGLLYWLNAPAVIRETEIGLIRNFLAAHPSVRVTRTAVRREPMVVAEEADGLGKVAWMQTTVSASLSSLGFVLVAETPREVPVETEKKTYPRVYPIFRYNDAS